jgi:hypothetical protein
MAYALLGREKEAKAIVEEFLMIDPRFSVKGWEMSYLHWWKNPADRAFLADALRKAGFPE